MHNELKITNMQTLESNKKTIEESTNPISLDLPDFTTDSYKDAYSRINAIVIEKQNAPKRPTLGSTPAIPEKAIASGIIAKATTKPERIFDFGSSNQFLDKYLDKFDIVSFFIIKKLPHKGGKIPCGSKIFFKVFNSFILSPKANVISSS